MSQTVWIAFYSDYSEFAFFTEEVDALRYAVEHSCLIAQVQPGVGVREQIAQDRP